MVAPTNKVCVVTNYRCGYLCVCVCVCVKIHKTLNQRENYTNP